MAAAVGLTVSVVIEGGAGGSWTLLRESGSWTLLSGEPERPTTRVRLDQDTARRLFFKGLTPQQAESRLEITGDRELGRVLSKALAVMA